MKHIGFFKKDNFRFRILTQLFQRSRPQRSNSVEELKKEISTTDYIEKTKFLIKQDLLLRYNLETIEEGLANFDLKISVKDSSQLQVNPDEAEPAPVLKQTEPTVRLNEILSEEKKQEIWKVHSRIPKWFANPHQINSRILISYLDLLGVSNSVPAYKLEAVCRSIETFKNNYNQMKTFGERNHAKVFEETGGRITLWEPVREFVKKEYLKRNRTRI